jgi:DNA primase
MGTALTEAQLRELRRLTGRLYLCFDADAAGEAATLRGMELAVAAGFDVRVVALPPGVDPAEAAEGFEERLASAAGYLLHRTRIEIDRAPSRQEAFVHVQEVLARAEPGPEWMEAARQAADRLDLPPELQAGLAPRTRRKTGTLTHKVLEAGPRLERRLLAACAAHPELVERYLVQLDDRHFDEPIHRRLRSYLVGETEPDRDLLALRAELDATAEGEHLDEDAAKELFLSLEERVVRRELAEVRGGDSDRLMELQSVLTKIHDALEEARP